MMTLLSILGFIPILVVTLKMLINEESIKNCDVCALVIGMSLIVTFFVESNHGIEKKARIDLENRLVRSGVLKVFPDDVEASK